LAIPRHFGPIYIGIAQGSHGLLLLLLLLECDGSDVTSRAGEREERSALRSR